MDIRSIRFWLRIALAVVGLVLMLLAPTDTPADAWFYAGLACFVLAGAGLIYQLMRMGTR